MRIEVVFWRWGWRIGLEGYDLGRILELEACLGMGAIYVGI